MRKRIFSLFTSLIMVISLVGFTMLSGCGKSDYLPAIQKSLDCIFNNNEEEYLNAQHPDAKKNYYENFMLGIKGTVNDENEEIIKRSLINEIRDVKEIYSYKGITADDNRLLDELQLNTKPEKSHLITFYLDSSVPEEKSVRCACFVYLIENKWYASFWDGSINCSTDIVEK